MIDLPKVNDLVLASMLQPLQRSLSVQSWSDLLSCPRQGSPPYFQVEIKVFKSFRVALDLRRSLGCEESFPKVRLNSWTLSEALSQPLGSTHSLSLSTDLIGP